MSKQIGWTGWADQIPTEQWLAYERVLRELTSQRIPFALGGGFASATHTGLWHGTKDLDIYILPEYRGRVIWLTQQMGLVDFSDQQPYDHSWTYRATDGKVIVEAIWSMRNQRANVDREWIERSQEAEIRGLRVRVAPAEEMIWHKLYVVLKERCDWPDVVNYLCFRADGLDWQHLLDRLGEDKPLLTAVIALFSWISPDRVTTIPAWVWERLGLKVQEPGSAADGLRHATLLSAYNWYGSMAEGFTLERSR
jgi:hypothetical protein